MPILDLERAVKRAQLDLEAAEGSPVYAGDLEVAFQVREAARDALAKAEAALAWMVERSRFTIRNWDDSEEQVLLLWADRAADVAAVRYADGVEQTLGYRWFIHNTR